MVQIGVFIGEFPQHPESRLENVTEAARLASEEGADLLFLPGHSFQNNWKEGPAQLWPARLADEFGLPILAETHFSNEAEKEAGMQISKASTKTLKKSVVKQYSKKSFSVKIQEKGQIKKSTKGDEKKNADGNYQPRLPWITNLYRPGGLIEGGWRQWFATSVEAEVEGIARQLVNDFRTGHRIFEIGGKRIGLIYCGENNILKNSQSDANIPRLRHPQLGWNDDYDLLLNPAHTVMGNLGKIHRRFEWFSSGGRTLIFTGNNDKKNAWTSAFYAFRDGKKIMSGAHPNLLRKRSWRLALVQA